MFKGIGSKIIVLYGAITVTAMLCLMWFYTHHQEKTILAQNELTMGKTAQSVGAGLQAVMVAGYADIAEDYARKLRSVPDILDFQVLRVDGQAAFLDNQTIDEVNRRIGDEEFVPREQESQRAVLSADNPHLRQVLESGSMVPVYESDASGEQYLVFLAPIANQSECQRCHGAEDSIRGLVKVTTSLKSVEQAIRQTQSWALVVSLAMLVAILAAASFFIRRSVVVPIKHVTQAMLHASAGNLNQAVPVYGRDEISSMAKSFNNMTAELLSTYQGLESEQDKLNTIILSAQEGIVVTDSQGAVVLTNPAAEALLGKSGPQIRSEGFFSLFDDETAMRGYLDASGDHQEPIEIRYNGCILSVLVAEIHNEAGQPIGSSALLRDITEEKTYQEQLIQISTTDALTGLYNRRYLDTTLAQELARAARYQHPLSVLMFDVDHFKRFNDTHGHDQGDRVLQSLGSTLKTVLRTVDIPCRYGGEEFLVILPDTSLPGAMTLAERVRMAVADQPVDGLHVTVSIGVASYPEVPATLPEQLVEAADKALYVSKEQGRNRVTAAATTDGLVASR